MFMCKIFIKFRLVDRKDKRDRNTVVRISLLIQNKLVSFKYNFLISLQLFFSITNQLFYDSTLSY